MVYVSGLGSARVGRNRAMPDSRSRGANMPSSGTFARVGLMAAVAVVVGISTFGSLLRQETPRAIAIGPVPVAATPAAVLPADLSQAPAPGPASADPPAAVMTPPGKVAVSSP